MMVATLYSLYLLSLVLALELLHPVLTSCHNIWKNWSIYVEGKLLFLSETAMAQASEKVSKLKSNCALMCFTVTPCLIAPLRPAEVYLLAPASWATWASSEGLRWGLSSTLHGKYLPKLCCLSSVMILKFGCLVQMLLYKVANNHIFACWFLAWIYTSSVAEFIMYKTKMVSNFLKTTHVGTLETKNNLLYARIAIPKRERLI